MTKSQGKIFAEIIKTGSLTTTNRSKRDAMKRMADAGLITIEVSIHHIEKTRLGNLYNIYQTTGIV